MEGILRQIFEDATVVTPRIMIPPTVDTGIVVPTYNRGYYLATTLNSLRESSLTNALIMIIDDASCPETQQLILDYQVEGVPIFKIMKAQKIGMWDSFCRGFDFMIQQLGIKYLCTLDSDTIHHPDWLQSLRELFFQNIERSPNLIVSGFNTKNKRHRYMKKYHNYYRKKSIGGINMFFDYCFYHSTVRNGFLENQKVWDSELCRKVKKKKGTILVTRPSVIQHIGAVGLHSGKPGRRGTFDTAFDFWSGKIDTYPYPTSPSGSYYDAYPGMLQTSGRDPESTSQTSPKGRFLFGEL